MTRDELLKMRNDLATRVEALRKVGDYGVGAADIMANTEDLFALAQHLLDRMRAPS